MKSWHDKYLQVVIATYIDIDMQRGRSREEVPNERDSDFIYGIVIGGCWYFVTVRLCLRGIITGKVRVLVFLEDEERFVTDTLANSMMSRNDVVDGGTCLKIEKHFYCYHFNLLDPELFFLILAHPVYKMWIIQEPNTIELWNKLHFEEEKTESIHHV